MNMDDLEDTDLGRRKVLLVAADFVTALARARKLQQLGCRVLGPAGSAREAVDLLHRTRPDLALLDPTLPERQLEQVIATLETRGVPVAFPTAGEGEWFLRGAVLGDALDRPLPTRDLPRLVRQPLQERGEVPADLPLVQIRDRIGYQCRVIAALVAAERDTTAAEAVLRRLERALVGPQAGAAACVT
jgi:CheY-like chemotaxis protein